MHNDEQLTNQLYRKELTPFHWCASWKQKILVHDFSHLSRNTLLWRLIPSLRRQEGIDFQPSLTEYVSEWVLYSFFSESLCL